MPSFEYLLIDRRQTDDARPGVDAQRRGDVCNFPVTELEVMVYSILPCAPDVDWIGPWGCGCARVGKMCGSSVVIIFELAL
jgi:hypothetical protein